MRFRAFTVALAMFACTSPAIAASDSITIPMKALNGSNENGSATLTQANTGVLVVVKLDHEPGGVPQPTHIHIGTCGNINAAPEYALKNTTDGGATTQLAGISLGDLLKQHYAINVHKSADDLGTYVSCGDIAR